MTWSIRRKRRCAKRKRKIDELAVVAILECLAGCHNCSMNVCQLPLLKVLLLTCLHSYMSSSTEDFHFQASLGRLNRQLDLNIRKRRRALLKEATLMMKKSTVMLLSIAAFRAPVQAGVRQLVAVRVEGALVGAAVSRHQWLTVHMLLH